MALPQSVHIFCRVVDNFGDIGVCWRLARQLVNEHELVLTLWVDDLLSFQKICSDMVPTASSQQVQGVVIRPWRADFEALAPDEVADVVIEAFGCTLPENYISAMAARAHKPVWINLEYLSAEAWVEASHGMPSHYPALPLIKHFFFPGFTDKTGGLLMERGLLERRDAFQEVPQAVTGFLHTLGVARAEEECTISLFCYPSAPVSALLAALQTDPRPSLCLVPQGVATDAVSAFLQQPATTGAMARRGSLRLQVVPFVDQPDYDRLLWSCDVNFVRGEDSMARAQWAGRPFVWQIYPQQEQAHQLKLDAFIERYVAAMPDDAAQALRAFWAAWNAGSASDMPWRALRSVLPSLQSHHGNWVRQLQQNGDLASNLIRFVRNIG